MSEPTYLLAFDQAEKTGWALSNRGVIIRVGSIIPPKGFKGLDAIYYQMRSIRDLIGRLQFTYWHEIQVAVEGTYLAQYGKGQAVTTKELLDELRGMIRTVCYYQQLAPPIVVMPYEVSEGLRMPVNTARFPKKLATIRAARLLCQERLPEFSDALLNSLAYLESWTGNRKGDPKKPEAALERAEKILVGLLPYAISLDACDACVINIQAQGKLQQEAIERL